MNKNSSLSLLGVVLPQIKPTLIKRWPVLLMFCLLSFVIGSIPTAKSTVESMLLQGVSDYIHPSGEVAETKADAGDFFSQKPEMIPGDDEDFVSKTTIEAFRRINYGTIFVLYALIALVGYFLAYLKELLLTGLKKEVFSNLRSLAFGNALRREPADRLPGSDDAGVATSAINKGAEAMVGLLGGILDMLSVVVSIFTLSWAIFSQDSRFFAFAAASVGILVGVSWLQARRLEKRRKEFDDKKNELAGSTDDIITNKEIILAYEMQGDYTEKIRKDAGEYAEKDRELDLAEKRYGLAKSGVWEFGRVGILFVIAFAAIMLGVASVAAIGTVYLILSLITKLYGATGELIGSYDHIKRTESTMYSFVTLLPNEVASPPEAKKRPSHPDLGIEFRDVQVKVGGKVLLNRVSFSVPSGSTVLILGESGCGKTTLGRTLLGFRRPSEGDILIGGKSTKDHRPEELRAMMSYIAQEQHVVDASVRENLRWPASARTATDEKLIGLLLRLGLIKHFVEGEAFLLRNARHHLSSGQRQRVAIARMLLDDSPIVVMDEPLSGADIFTIQKVFPVFVEELKQTNKTVFLITHQMCLAALAEYAVVLDPKGVVVDQGPVAVLKNSAGRFGQLYQEARKALG